MCVDLRKHAEGLRSPYTSHWAFEIEIVFILKLEL